MPSRKIKPRSGRPASPREGERLSAQLSGLLAKREFQSPEELDAYLASLVGKDLRSIGRDDATDDWADDVWDLLEQAQEASNPKQRAALARQILDIDPDNADAYLLMAEDARTPADELALLTEAVRAGERAISEGVETLAADGGMWLAVESRPYMRARAAVAIARWRMGDRQLAINDLWELLRLNPGDNQGLRYLLLAWLMSAGCISDIERLLALHGDDGAAAWQFDRALHAFRTLGECAASTKLLKAAMKQNPHVAPLMLGITPMPDFAPDYIGFGDETEAAAYVGEALLRWGENPLAMEWLIRNAAKGVARTTRRR